MKKTITILVVLSIFHLSAFSNSQTILNADLKQYDTMQLLMEDDQLGDMIKGSISNPFVKNYLLDDNSTLYITWIGSVVDCITTLPIIDKLLDSFMDYVSKNYPNYSQYIDYLYINDSHARLIISDEVDIPDTKRRTYADRVIKALSKSDETPLSDNSERKYEIFVLPSVSLIIDPIFKRNTTDFGIGFGFSLRDIFCLEDVLSLSLKSVVISAFIIMPTIDIKLWKTRMYAGLGFSSEGRSYNIGLNYRLKYGLELGLDWILISDRYQNNNCSLFVGYEF